MQNGTLPYSRSLSDIHPLPSPSPPPVAAVAVKGWTPEQVSRWAKNVLAGTGVESLVSARLIEEEVGGAELLVLDKGDLNALGCVKIGHMRRLYNAIAQLQLPS